MRNAQWMYGRVVNTKPKDVDFGGRSFVYEGLWVEAIEAVFLLRGKYVLFGGDLTPNRVTTTLSQDGNDALAGSLVLATCENEGGVFAFVASVTAAPDWALLLQETPEDRRSP